MRALDDPPAATNNDDDVNFRNRGRRPHASSLYAPTEMGARRALHVVTALTVLAGLVVLVAGWKEDAREEATKHPLRVALPEPRFAPANPTVDFGSGPVVSTAPPSTTAPTTVPLTAAPTSPPPNSGAPSTPSATTPPTVPAATVPPAVVARVTAPTLSVSDSPGAAPSLALYSTTEFGNPRVLLVTQQGGDWVRVLLPTRPNGAEGWVRRRDVALSTVADAVDIDLAARALVWTREGVVQMRATVGIGASRSPTPPGTFFVTDVLAENPDGAYGAWIIALNAHSDAFTVFEGGDPRIAIHGTNAPASLGAAASNGCLHLDAGSLAQLAGVLPLGTPVTIH
jgi:lipoprotein-anchoring transpeptidase ErfK/SrfK